MRRYYACLFDRAHRILSSLLCSLVHSFILDPTDIVWKSWLSQEELNTIQSTGNPGLPKLDASITDMFDQCALAVTSLSESNPKAANDHDAIIDILWESITQLGFFNPRTHSEHDWLQRTILDYLCMYRNKTLDELVVRGSEMDFVIRCWANLDRSFEDIAIVGR